MRNGNAVHGQWMRKSCWFLSYLWGMETYGNESFVNWRRYVLILPMRNGNISNHFLGMIYTIIRFLSYLWGMETIWIPSIRSKFFDLVLILPMRNGNLPWRTDTLLAMSFLSYLWGMETRSSAEFQFLFRLFLSYLWGMETSIISL